MGAGGVVIRKLHSGVFKDIDNMLFVMLSDGYLNIHFIIIIVYTFYKFLFVYLKHLK